MPHMPGDLVLVEVADQVAVVTLNRPERRNALSVALLGELGRVLGELEADADVAAIVLTGADPAFCAGLDLEEVGRDGGALADPSLAGGPWPALTTPVIGAVNGPAATGGLELALHCDWLVASERARFVDTHARVGVQPLWGLTVLLPQAVGLRRAREMSATGNAIDAATALAWGLVNHVVAHDELLPVATRLAADVASSDARAVRTLLATYDRGSRLSGAEALALEREVGLAWQRSEVSPEAVEARRRQVISRGRGQLRGSSDRPSLP